MELTTIANDAPIKTVGTTIRQRKMLPVKLCFINVYTYHNHKPTLTVMHIQQLHVIFVVVDRRDTANTGNQQ